MPSRRSFLQTAAAATAAICAPEWVEAAVTSSVLEEFPYGDVQLAAGSAQQQFEQTQAVLLSLNEDSLLKPWRTRAGLPAPGPDLGGWYDEVPLTKTDSGGHGFAPGHCFGQWISALSRGYAINHDAATRAKLQHLLALYEPAISGRFYTNFRFPAYDFDKMVIGLIDAKKFANLPEAQRLLDLTADAAVPHLPPQALDRDEPQRRWRESRGENTANDYTWDESYTLPENLYLAYTRGAGERYRKLASRFLLDKTYFDPLADGTNVLPKHHAYSFCNALSSAMQAYLVDGSVKHLRAAINAFDMIASTQSFATGGWGPNESFVTPATGALGASLTATHRGFETPCGSYAHFKLTRYLLRVTGNARYADSMEQVLYNTVLGAKPLQRDGRAFYYSDYHDAATKTYFPDAWPCCSGTLPQVAADYRILIYLRNASSVFVNLYLPSELRWTAEDGAQIKLEQSGGYPLDGNIRMNLRASRPSTFALRLRIPAWCDRAQATLRLNGVPISPAMDKGYAVLQRTWKDGDRIDLNLPLTMRLTPVDAQHPNTVALMRGPLVLFATGNPGQAPTQSQLLAAQRVDGTTWQTGAMLFKPFTAIEDEHYRTYLNVT